MATEPQNDTLAYLYDGSLEGILCAIYDSYKRHEAVRDVYTLTNAQPRIGQIFHEVKTNIETATRVRQRLIDICGYDTYAAIRTASLSEDSNKGSACLSFARFALGLNRRRWKDATAKRINPTRAIASPEARPLLELERYVMNERHYMQQFLRFEELEGDVWVATCHPKASVVPLLMDYFVARFNTQSFIIYDARHQLAGVYEGAWGQTRYKPLNDANARTEGSNMTTGAVLDTGTAATQKDFSKSVGSHRKSLAGHDTKGEDFHAKLSKQTMADRHQAAPMRNRAPWYLVQSDELTLPKRSENEEVMRQAWKRFYRTVSIDERYNPELRRNFMPMRFWDDLTEMQLD